MRLRSYLPLLVALPLIASVGCQERVLREHAPALADARDQHEAGDPPAPAPVVGQEQDDEEREMLRLINRHRAESGLGALSLNPVLIRSARWLSRDMADRGYLSHTDSQGRNSSERMTAFGFDPDGWRGENIACGNADAQATYLQWLNSPGHNANMLGEHYSVIGVARAYAEGAQCSWSWTTDFGP